MKDTDITCPKCGAEIPLSEAVSHQLRGQLEADFALQRAEQSAAIRKREQQVEAERESLSQRQSDFAQEVSKQVEIERQKLLADAVRQAEDKFGAALKDAKGELAEHRTKLQRAQQTELELRKEQRQLQEARESLELEVERKLSIERQKIADAARQQAVESERLKQADKDNVIKGLQEQIAALQQRSQQGSIQLQGETLEVDLEQRLRAAFPFDEVREIKKGQRGADVAQHVRTGAGGDCGVILWEAKRARNWSADWPEKLKADQREAKAELAVIVTTSPADGVRGMAPVDGVWVCEPSLAVALGVALRQGLISTAAQRAQQAGRADKMTALYEHLCSVEFRHHIEAIVESFLGLQEQLASEQRAFAKQWKEREQHLQKAVAHTAMLYGGIQGITGRGALPDVKCLAFPG